MPPRTLSLLTLILGIAGVMVIPVSMQAAAGRVNPVGLAVILTMVTVPLTAIVSRQ